eukprot:CAMPEP_0170455636 /NCGR_PEP_ID=MMETSP0123-20130129/3535_1 /TAXON_ID=182087 /ORGANISM="Favella ehrenbergii, Strain Fehren 1" /LENGTH=270 /DNA_ID=CAMNT_0010718841 /DNA_START=544 /DNA_END=1356 /DNA_ORIENTATION=+
MEQDVLVEDEGEGEIEPNYDAEGVQEDNFGTYTHEKPRKQPQREEHSDRETHASRETVETRMGEMSHRIMVAVTSKTILMTDEGTSIHRRILGSPATAPPKTLIWTVTRPRPRQSVYTTRSWSGSVAKKLRCSVGRSMSAIFSCNESKKSTELDSTSFTWRLRLSSKGAWQLRGVLRRRLHGGSVSSKPPDPKLPDQAGMLSPEDLLTPDVLLSPDELFTPEDFLVPEDMLTPEDLLIPDNLVTIDDLLTPEDLSGTENSKEASEAEAEL